MDSIRDIPLQLAAKLRQRKDKTPYAYVLKFEDGSQYIGSATGMYRLCYYASAAKGNYPSFNKNPLLMAALLTLECRADVLWCATLEEARLREKALWLERREQGVTLRNCREFGHSGRWIQQEEGARKRRMDAIHKNGHNSKMCSEKLPDGRSRATIKSVLSRALNKGQELKKLKNLDPKLLEELLSELKQVEA